MNKDRETGPFFYSAPWPQAGAASAFSSDPGSARSGACDTVSHPRSSVPVVHLPVVQPEEALYLLRLVSTIAAGDPIDWNGDIPFLGWGYGAGKSARYTI